MNQKIKYNIFLGGIKPESKIKRIKLANPDGESGSVLDGAYNLNVIGENI
jgi:hypothetical protein